MSASLIGVSPEALNTYASMAGQCFQDMATTLGNIVTDIDNVQYTGQNAQQFKSSCEEVATEYVTFMNNSLTEMGNAIVAAARGIEGALGGAVISGTIEPVNVSTAMNDASGEDVIINTEQFADAKKAVEGHFARLEELLSTHKTEFDRAAASWQGNARDKAAEAVATITTKSQNETSKRLEEISKYMAQQLESASTADGASAS